jgi:hypothetical protein
LAGLQLGACDVATRGTEDCRFGRGRDDCRSRPSASSGLYLDGETSRIDADQPALNGGGRCPFLASIGLRNHPPVSVSSSGKEQAHGDRSAEHVTTRTDHLHDLTTGRSAGRLCGGGCNAGLAGFMLRASGAQQLGDFCEYRLLLRGRLSETTIGRLNCRSTSLASLQWIGASEEQALYETNVAEEDRPSERLMQVLPRHVSMLQKGLDNVDLSIRYRRREWRPATLRPVVNGRAGSK